MYSHLVSVKGRVADICINSLYIIEICIELSSVFVSSI